MSHFNPDYKQFNRPDVDAACRARVAKYKKKYFPSGAKNFMTEDEFYTIVAHMSEAEANRIVHAFHR